MLTSFRDRRPHCQAKHTTMIEKTKNRPVITNSVRMLNSNTIKKQFLTGNY